MIIFKGKPDGLIARRKLPTLDPTSIYACQDAAWMDERCMLIWVDEVFGAYLVANPPPEGVQPVLLLDSYQRHMMALVVSRIKAMGVHVIHIAGGCTGLTQPLDVGINRSFKARCCQMWEEWLVDLLDMTNQVHDGTRKEVSEWAAALFWELVGSRILRNSWRKTGFDWFPGVVDPDDIVDGGGGGDDGHENGNAGDEGGEDNGYMSDDSLFDSDDEEGEESEDDEDSDDEEMHPGQAQPGHIDDRRKALLNARTSVAPYQGLDVADQEKQDGEPTNAYIEGANYLLIEEMSLMPRRLLCPDLYGR